MKKGEFVFEYGDAGTKFYIILSGKVSVLLPDQSKLKEIKERKQ